MFCWLQKALAGMKDVENQHTRFTYCRAQGQAALRQLPPPCARHIACLLIQHETCTLHTTGTCPTQACAQNQRKKHRCLGQSGRACCYIVPHAIPSLANKSCRARSKPAGPLAAIASVREVRISIERVQQKPTLGWRTAASALAGAQQSLKICGRP